MKKFLFIGIALFALSACCGSNDKKDACSGHDHSHAGHSHEKESCEAKAPLKLLITAYIHVKEDKIDAFKEVFQNVQAKSNEEEGCISYTLYQNPNTPTTFMVYEEWKDQAAIDSHNNSEHFKEFGSKVGELLSSENIITISEISAERK